MCLLPLLGGGCQTVSPVPARADLSTPKSAALSYLRAVQYQDVKTARAVSIGTLEEKSWIDSLCTMLDGMRRYDAALTAKFGHVTNQIHVDLWESIRGLADQPVELIAEGQESGDGQQARIDPPRRGFKSHSQGSIYLRKDPQGWKVDLAQTYAKDVPPDQLETISAGFLQTRLFGQVFQKTARDVQSGQFKSMKEATKALAERLAEVHQTEAE